MALLDIVVFLLIGGFGVRGLLRGFVCEALSLGAVILGILAVRFLHAPFTGWLAAHVGGEYVGALLAFVLLFGLVYMLGRLLANFIGGHVRRSALGAFDRLLGLGFGAVKGLLIATLAFAGFTILYDALYGDVTRRPDWMRHARAYPLLNASSSAMSAWIAQSRRDGGLLHAVTGSGDNDSEAGNASAN